MDAAMGVVANAIPGLLYPCRFPRAAAPATTSTLALNCKSSEKNARFACEERHAAKATKASEFMGAEWPVLLGQMLP
jgi:hypothetical protein